MNVSFLVTIVTKNNSYKIIVRYYNTLFIYIIIHDFIQRVQLKDWPSKIELVINDILFPYRNSSCVVFQFNVCLQSFCCKQSKMESAEKDSQILIQVCSYLRPRNISQIAFEHMTFLRHLYQLKKSLKRVIIAGHFDRFIFRDS